MNGLNWFWIGVMVTAPFAAALLLAYPLWRQRQPIFGNIVGTIVIFGSVIALMLREYAELDRLAQACDEPCFPVPGAFTRYAVYAFIGLAEVFALFALSLKVERKIRNRGYAPEWR